MIYEVKYMPVAQRDIEEMKKSDIQSYNKAMKLVEELHEHPRTGTGKPEQLKYGRLKGLWSRRITDRNRLVYSIENDKIIVYILSAIGHY